MGLDITERKLDSNLYFKVEGGRPVMLLLYVDDLFLIGKDKLIVDAKRKLLVTPVSNVSIYRVRKAKGE